MVDDGGGMPATTFSNSQFNYQESDVNQVGYQIYCTIIFMKRFHFSLLILPVPLNMRLERKFS